MATAGVTLSPKPEKKRLQARITTTDAALTVVTVDAGIERVTVQISGADARLQALGAVQDAAVASTAGYGQNGQSWDIGPGMCGGAAQGSWSFGLARDGSSNATFDLWAKVW